MATLREAAEQLAVESVCGMARAADAAADYFANALSKIPGVGPNDPSLNDSIPGLFCPESPPPPPDITSPFQFSGGQCPTLYRVNSTGSYFSSFFNERRPTQSTTLQVRGPISNPQVVQDGNVIRWLIDAFNKDTNAAETFQLRAVTASSGTVSDGVYESINIERVDEQPDDCGDPDIDGRPQYNTDITYVQAGVSITAPVTVFYSEPVIGVNGDLSIPITIEGPDFSVNPVWNFGDGTVNFSLGLGDGDGKGCGPGTENPPDLPPDPEDEEPEETRYFRALVVVSTIGDNPISATEVSAGGGLSLFAPRLGTVSLRLRVGEGRNAYFPDVNIKHKRQIVVVPESFVGNGYNLQPIAGVTFQAFPLYLKNYNNPEVE